MQAVDISERDLLRAELFTAPLVLFLLVVAFRSVVAALLPVVVAVVACVITLAVLRPPAGVMEMSVFSLGAINGRGQGDARHPARWKQAYGRRVRPARSAPAGRPG